jgi:hypothetical protein
MTFEDSNRILVALIVIWACCALWPAGKKKDKQTKNTQ